MRKILIIILILVATGNTLFAQKGYGTNAPDQQSVLDLTSSNKGLLIPRVALSATNNISPFTATPATSMLVYNTATTGDVTPGFYYYNGSAWVKLSASGDGSSLTFGTSPNYIQYNGTAGYFQYYGDNTVWDDLRIQVTTRSGSVAPVFTSGFAGNANLFTYQFDDATVQNVYFEAQMPHSWAGTTIYPHVHWSPVTANTGTCKWVLEYTWVNYDGTFGASGTLALDGVVSSASQWKHMIASNASGITPTASQNGISAMLICRIYRDAGVAGDDLTGKASLLSIDFHFEKNTEGSQSQYTK